VRTTIDIPDELFRQLKIRAASQNVTLKILVQRAIENELVRGRARAQRRRLRFPLLASKQPGALNLTNAEIEDLLT